MACTNPLTAYQLKEYQGDTCPIVFKRPDLLHLYKELQVPCGDCIADRRCKSILRSIQLACELQTTVGQSWFITFTYDDEHIPDNLSLYKPHIYNCIKAIRRYRNKNNHPGKFRYEQCGEYGTKTFRPHHHMAAFNLTLDDLELYSDGKYKSYTSETMQKLWPHGQVVIIELNHASCLYIAQHSDKKIANSIPNHEPEVLNAETGEISKDRVPEYSTRSSRPGIGADWYDQFGQTDLYNTDSIVIDGKQYKIPHYFDKFLKIENPELYEEIKAIRKENAIPKTREENAYQANFDKITYERKLRETV